jgi:myo-inositol-1(or 4)-monophosphatase
VRPQDVPSYHPANHTGTINRRLIGASNVGAAQVEVVLGVIEKGKGAFLNNRRLRVSARTDLMECMVSTGVGTGTKRDLPGYMKEFLHVTARTAGVRCLGSAALDLAYVAAGRVDGFWEAGLSSWDVAAGIILVREAGGFISDASGGDYSLGGSSLLAASAGVHAQLVKTLKESRTV